ncbi:preQ(1) synthase [Verrucomicrobia bacterium]|nr:preQ(1) synthase [Verrucomicrobiota bacterium]
MNTKQTKNPSGVTLLGNSVVKPPESPENSILEAFENHFSKRDFSILVDCPDFTSLCPVTGQPDFAHITIEYIPDCLCVESKSLKLYLGAYRNTPSFNEEIVNRILDDLVETIHPRRITVTGKFASRGGISLTIVSHYPQKGSEVV